ncbi:MAG: hypothetical protein EOP82_24120 [Variovorax sp.]|nr:MAG: hypothetical protein EOP82_24120 [Variovorax sp.]
MPDLNVREARLQERVNGVLALLSYSVVPDLASSSLSIASPQTGNPSIAMSQFAGGFTVSASWPLYLEGGIAASRYDPTFYASNGREERAIPVKWNNAVLTGGVGWDFPVLPELKFRPIVNLALGRVASDLAIARTLLDRNGGPELDFLDRGHLDAYGLGGSLMLDYERYRPESDVDVELRYTHIRLQSFGTSSPAVQGHADATTASLWSRYRAPTGFTALQRPLRYVLEYAYTRYLGDQAGVLGFSSLHSVGVGLELDSSAHDLFITRTRLLVRQMFGQNVSGFSVGLAVSF